jgi:predicted secreted protein
MLPIKEIVIIIILLILLIISSTLVTLTDARMQISDEDEKIAHNYLKISSIIGWISIALIIVGAILLVVYGSFLLRSPFGGIVLSIVYWIIIIIITICGVYDILGLIHMKKGTNSQNTNKKYILYIYISTALSLISAIIIIIYYLIKMFKKSK